MNPVGRHHLEGIDHALVVGLGASGRAAARALREAGVGVILVDDDPHHPAARELEADGVQLDLGRAPVEALTDEVGLVVPSPGVPERAPVLRQAAARGVPIWSEPELGMRLYPHRLLAVTGTNGKTSTTELTVAMLAAGGVPVAACGNIGRPVTEAAAEEPPETVLVAELSSFQLRFVSSLRAEVGALLNIAPDHLDWHGDLDAYGRAKARIWAAQTVNDWAVANQDDATTLRLREEAAGHPAAFSGVRSVPVGVGREGDELILRGASGERTVVVEIDELRSDAPHHVANVAAAACIALLAGTDLDGVRRAARAFSPGPHRLETVATAAGVSFVNDSKATNLHAAAAALQAFDAILWIAGGLAKGVDLGPLGDHLDHVRAGFFIGTAAEELTGICRTRGVPAEPAGDLDAAVAAAYAMARPGDTILLAPACASFDQFRDYAERGERFRAAAQRVVQDGASGSSGSRQRPEVPTRAGGDHGA